MKITKTVSGKQEVRISKSEWKNIGIKQGWIPMKEAQEQPQQLNARQTAMIDWYNVCFNQNIPVTSEGYSQLGRSQGIIQAIASDPNAFYTFTMRQNDFTPASLVTNVFQQISR